MNPTTALARVIIDELHRCGVAHAVISPGSWSTPLTLALAHHPGITTHVRIDERSAAFTALGLAKVSRQPVAVVCTSGTAAANFFPAVIEADYSDVPLVLLTADRPVELRDIGASQTIDQHRLFGSYTRSFAELAAHQRAGEVRQWRAVVARAVGRATEPPGPVQLNVAFRKPLIPTDDGDWVEPLTSQADDASHIRVIGHRPLPVAVPAPARGLIVIGDSPTPADVTAAHAFAAAAGWPVYAEPSSNARHGANIVTNAAMLAAVPAFRVEHQPECVITVGRPTLGSELLDLCAQASRHIVVAAQSRWPNPEHSVTDVIAALGAPTAPQPEPRWLASWQRADRIAQESIDSVLGQAELSELQLAQELCTSIPAGALLFLGSSMPIRDVNTTMPARDDLTVLTNRGVAGIDGVVSTAIGAALAHQNDGGGPAFALVGDLTMLHDHNGLVLGPEEPKPDLTFVVVNNDGGGIFSTLAQATLPAATFERFWGTPHRVDFAALAAATNTPHFRITTSEQLKTSIQKNTSSLRILEIRTDRNENAKLHEALFTAVTNALS